MKCWILKRDVACEFGEVLGVYSTKKKGRAALKKVCKDYDLQDLSIEEYVIDAPRSATEPELI